jgi:hypothetical protein
LFSDDAASRLSKPLIIAQIAARSSVLGMLGPETVMAEEAFLRRRDAKFMLAFQAACS